MKDAEKIINVFAAVPEIKQAIIYGSRAKGNYRNGSDIDIVIEGENMTLSELFKIVFYDQSDYR